jgi:2-oxoglutarate ferredoxin oxidoreductase subunit beta
VTRPAHDYQVAAKPIWCPYCGNYGVLGCFLLALERLALDPARLALVSGIGCAGRFPAFVRCYGLHVAHGRALPVASGLKAARPDLTVVALGGDGDGLGIGGGHFLNAGRRNLDLTYLLFDNSIYGMTKGQPSPTTPGGTRSRSTPYGNPDAALEPASLAILAGYTFVGRGYPGHVGEELVGLIAQAIAHRGSSFVQILTPCVTHNRAQTYEHYQQRAAWLEPGPVPGTVEEALRRAQPHETIPLGVFYRVEAPTYADRVAAAGGADRQGQ